MTPETLRMTPAAALLALVAYCAWCVEGPPTPAAGKPLPAFSPKLLTSAAGEPPSRDPFGVRPDEAPVVAKAAVARSAATTPPAGKGQAGGAAAAKRVQAAALTLTATSVGEHSLAVINGRLYAEGERVRPAGKAAAAKGPPEEAWVVARIVQGKALLRRGAEEAELSFRPDGVRPQAKGRTP